MLLTIDIGNTTITVGVFSGESIHGTWRLSTDVHRTADEYAIQLLALFEHENILLSNIDDAIISSVVPPLTAPIQALCQRYLQCDPVMIEPGIRTGVRVATDNPREVGADRVVNAAAAHRNFGGPLMVIDFGTATTIDVVSEDGDYIGGAIAPGIEVAMEALYARAAKLPRIELQFPPSAIGKNTIHAMQSGLLFGYVGLIEGIVLRIKEELGTSDAKVIATGGLSSTIASAATFIDHVDPDLTLQGMRLIYDLNRPARD